jgi:hypothetical protein
MATTELSDADVFGAPDAPPMPGGELSDDEVFGADTTRGLGNKSNVLARGLSKGAAGILGAPVDLLTAWSQGERQHLQDIGGVPIIPEIKRPIGGSQSIMDLIDYLGMGGEEPQTGGEKAIARVGEEVGASMIPGVGLAGRTASPAKFLAENTGLALTGGAGAAAAGAVVPEDQGWKHQIADFVGATAGSLGPMGLRHLFSEMLKHVPIGTAAKEASAARALDLDENSARALGDAEADAPQIPGVQYTPAELLNDPNLLTTKRQLDRSSKEAAAANVDRQNANNQALTAYSSDAAPEGDVGMPRIATARQKGAVTGRLQEAEDNAVMAGNERVSGATAASDEAAQSAQQAAADDLAAANERAQGVTEEAKATAAQRAADLAAQHDAQIAAARGDVSEAAGDVLQDPRGAKAETSRTAREELLAAQDEAEEQASRLYRLADPDNQVRVDTSAVEGKAAEIAATAEARGRKDAIPPLIKSGEIQEFYGPQSVERLNGLRSRLGEEIREAQRNGKRQLAAHLVDLQRSVDGALDGMVDQQISARMQAGETEQGNALARERDQWLAKREPDAGRIAGVGGDSDSLGRALGEEAGGQRVGARRSSTGKSPTGAGDAGNLEDGGQSGTGGSGSAQAASDALKVARKFFRENVAAKFRSGTVGDVLKTGYDNRPRVDPSATLGKVLTGRPGQEEALQDFLTAVDGRPNAVQALQDHALADLAQYAVDTTGQLVPRKVAAWRQKYAPVLKQFPELEKTTANLQRLQEQVDAAESAKGSALKAAEAEGRDTVRAAQRAGREDVSATQAKGRESVRSAQAEGREKIRTAKEESGREIKTAVGRKKRSTGAIEKSSAQFWLDRSPDKAVSGILSAKDPLQAAKETLVMVRKGGGQEAVNGVHRAAWDHVVNKMFSSVENGGVKAAVAEKFLNDNAPALKILLGGSEQFNRAKDIVRAAQINSRSGRAVAGAGSDTAQNVGGVKGIALMAAREGTSPLLGAITGNALGGPVGAALGGVAAKSAELFIRHQRQAVQNLMREALNDPATFRLLTTRLSKENERGIARAIEAKITNYGIREGARQADDE